MAVSELSQLAGLILHELEGITALTESMLPACAADRVDRHATAIRQHVRSLLLLAAESEQRRPSRAHGEY